MPHPSAFNSEDSGQPERQLQLVVHAGPLAGKGFPIVGDTLTFGREPDNNIVLDDTQVSRYHARLLRQGDEIMIEDLGSTNGTLINGNRVTGQQLLQPADIISIGASIFGVKGFSAPNTIGVTQVTAEPFTYTPPRPSIPTPAAPSDSSPAPIAPPPQQLPARPASRPQPTASPPSRLTFLAIGGGVALIVTILIIAGLTAYFLNQNGSSSADIPTVTITSPGSNSQVRINQATTVQATGSSAAGVTRLELWISGVKNDEAISPAANGQQTLTASFQWTPNAPGTYTLEVRAYNAQGAVSVPTGVTVNAVGDEPVGGDGTATPTPEPIETVAGNPSLTTKTDLNVRGGPGIMYDLMGLLPTGTEAEIIGRDNDRQWWQIRFDPASDGRGWVAADPAFSTAANVENVPIAQPPPTPTGTATHTPIPPTNTPTPTQQPSTATPTFTLTPTVTDVPITNTPTLTPTATGEATTIDFTVDPTSIKGGDCVTIRWEVNGVKEIYFGDEGVGGSGTRQDCPNVNTTYRLRVIKLDDTEQTQEIQVEVTEPASVKSSGTLVAEPGDAIDIDDGEIESGGDDFIWEIAGGIRHFRVLSSGTEIAVMGNFGSLNDVSRSDCLNAGYGSYTFIDASDSAPDPNNTLIDGRMICFKTNSGRIGKLRFPQYSSEDLTFEWVTWQN